MKAAPAPRPSAATRLLVLEPDTRRISDHQIDALASLMRPGDLIVVNDAATFPASLAAWTARGERIELRLVAPPEGRRARVVLFGDGDWRTPTEHRPAPPLLEVGERIAVAGTTALVVARSPLSPRLVTVAFEADAWSAIYAHGRPVQYSYLAADLPLSAFQTSYASRPWAAEMPSAGRPLSITTLAALRLRGVAVATITHAAGLSSTGDAALDAALPLAERYDIPATTVAALAATRARGGRVVAVGTTVVRALEGAAERDGEVHAGSAETRLIIGPGFAPRVVDALLTTMHDPSESHYQLLLAFADDALLRAGHAHASALGYLAHELGDATLVLRGVSNELYLRPPSGPASPSVPSPPSKPKNLAALS